MTRSDAPLRRYAREYLFDVDGMYLPGWLADWLETHTDVARVRIAVRGADATVDEALSALRVAAMRHRSSADGSDCGTSLDGPPEPGAPLTRPELLTTAQTASLAGKSDRAVRKAIAQDRLRAQLVGGRYLVARRDAEAFRRAS